MSRLLDKINGPQDLKKLTKEELPALATEIRETLLVDHIQNRWSLGVQSGCRRINDGHALRV